MQDFYITLPSNTNGAQNTTSNFRVRLPEEIQLTGGEWEVGLVELQFPCSWYNVSDELEEDVYSDLVHSKLRQNEIEFVLMSGHEVCVKVAPGNYKTVNELITAISVAIENAELINLTIDKVLDDIDSSTSDLSKHISFGYEHNKVYFKAVYDNMIKHVQMSQMLRYILGFEKTRFPGNKKEKIHAKYPPDLRAGIESFFIYTDIIAPQLVGNKRAQVLRIVPVSGTFGEIVDRTFVTPHYVPVLKKVFASIDISIKTDQDRPFSFQFGKSIVKLHFRKRFSLRI